MTQMLSCESTVTPDTWPRIQLLGRCLGQKGSGSNFGTSVTAAAATRATENSPATAPSRIRDLITPFPCSRSFHASLIDEILLQPTAIAIKMAAQTAIYLSCERFLILRKLLREGG